MQTSAQGRRLAVICDRCRAVRQGLPPLLGVRVVGGRLWLLNRLCCLRLLPLHLLRPPYNVPHGDLLHRARRPPARRHPLCHLRFLRVTFRILGRMIRECIMIYGTSGTVCRIVAMSLCTLCLKRKQYEPRAVVTRRRSQNFETATPSIPAYSAFTDHGFPHAPIPKYPAYTQPSP